LGTSGYVYFHFFLNAADPSGITVVKGRLPHRKATFTNQEIAAIEDANKTKYNTANQIAVWALLLTEHPLQTQEQLCFRDSL
jgi:hypothetical protein